ncbi:IgGFc-binding protein-like [Hemicordylus capensis]|uniref:IgGFc-binding protein-like n=1 Tax=Hemicordylus capensis TaxID=884348 RepID=UPI00230439A1|nr:IgGFc-binding protein-like [Hemicordylus capensis]XP_053122700.1 IgGFc-binding protein-like [Hemicordylus capensis]XP_053122701.1 IgGFc-binding protein-like [Hemicordylus capensis]XP_053122703.1 IgGFc-binding protein-like [Hemicordylus capensis]XP_053122704.1 IgGFc-binding protein-like [Hemicordylus capensis]XP_053122705.1 IgGFc-binding protein-like [Hemicordylus capensis]
MAIKRIIFILAGLALLGGPCGADPRGKEFVTAFLQNYWQEVPNADFRLLITGYHPATSVTVIVNNSTFQRATINAGQTVSVHLPGFVEMLGTNTFDKTMLIQADKDISVFSYNYKNYSSAATVVYPVQQLGLLYYVVTPVGDTSNTFKEFAVVAHEDPTRVDIHLKGAVSFKGRDYPAGSRLVVDLEPFQTIQLQSSDDLSGTRVESSGPVAVLSGHSCAKQNTQCDHVVEQLLPVSSWGTTFIVPPLSIQSSSDVVYVVTSQSTLIRYQVGPTQNSRNTNAGQVIQIEVKRPHPLYISADAGIQVLFFFTGAKTGVGIYDPFLINIPALTSYCTSYHIDGIRKSDNYAVVITKSTESNGITFKRKAVGNIQWRVIPGTEYSWAEHRLGREDRALSLEHPSTPFGLYIFGVSYMGGYGYSSVCPSSQPVSSCSSMKCGSKEQCEILRGQPMCVPKSGSICRAYGGPHYHTFDGKHFDFMGTCTYTIAKTCSLDPTLPFFSVEAKNENRGNAHGSYIGSVTVRVYDTIIAMARNEIGLVRVNYQQSQLPISLQEGKLRLFQSGISVHIETDFSLRVSYNWDSNLAVKISSRFSESLCGLCGDYNGDPDNDFTMPDGSLAPSPVEFGRSWKVKDGHEFCWDDCNGECQSYTPEKAKKYKAEPFCGWINKGGDGPFSQCHAVIDPQPFLDDCVFDVSLNDGLKNVLCDALKNYADACQGEGAAISDWRTPTGCSLPCPENSQYKACGPPCPATCNGEAGPTNCSSLPCVETCQCNEGFVLNAGKCIPSTSCGCIFEGKLFSPGEQFWGDDSCTRRCTCDRETKRVACQAARCRSGEQCKVQDGLQNCYPTSFTSCSASGGLHYLSFDGKRFDFQGNCVYQFTGLREKRNDLEDFLVLVQNDHQGSQSVPFLQRVEISIYGTAIVKSREQPGKVLVNGLLNNLPYRSRNNDFSMNRRGQTLVIQTDFSLTVTFD